MKESDKTIYTITYAPGQASGGSVPLDNSVYPPGAIAFVPAIPAV